MGGRGDGKGNGEGSGTDVGRNMRDFQKFRRIKGNLELKE